MYVLHLRKTIKKWGTFFTSEKCPRGTIFPRVFYPGGQVSQGTLFTATPAPKDCVLTSDG